MKIDLYPNNTFQCAVNKKNPNPYYYNKGLKQDSFVKTTNAKNPSFHGISSFAQKYTPFEKEILDYYKTKPAIDINEIKQIVEKYSPMIQIKKLSEVGQNVNIHNRTGAYFKDEILFNSEGICKNGEKGIFLKPLTSNDLADKIAFLSSLIHETTHLFQETSSDRISKFAWIKQFYEIPQNFEEQIQTLALFPKFFKVAEYNINLPLTQNLQKINEIPLPVKAAGKNELNNIYQKMTGRNVPDFIELIINATANHLGLPKSKFNQKKLLEYLALLSEKEYEAYTNQVKFTKQALNQNGSTDMDLLVKLYEMFYKHCQFLSEIF